MPNIPTYGFPNNQVTNNVNGVRMVNKIGQPYLLDLVTLERVVFQSIPKDMKYKPEAVWLSVPSAGWNNPRYNYTGGEDVLNFSITWYSDEAGKQDVMRKLKWIESLSRNNGFDEKPHKVQFIMGSLFTYATWIVASAEYSLDQFDRTAGMMPRFASQEITLKRVTEINRSRTDIQSIYS